MTGPPYDAVARSLAYAFLAADTWDQRGLEAAGRLVLGRWHGWLRPLVGEVREAYASPPRDRPRELTRLLSSSPVLAEGIERPGAHRVSVRVRTAEPTRMGERRWPVPVVDDLGALPGLLQIIPDHLEWLADPQSRGRNRVPGPYQLYRYRWLSRPGAVPRLLEVPSPILRGTLRRLKTAVLDQVPTHPAAHGFVHGRSALSHARAHVGQQVVVTLDLRHFFTAVTAGRAYGLFRSLGYPEPVAHVLAGLVSNRVPGPVLTRMPSGGDATARHRLRRWLGTPHLPQGAPSSPAVANLICFTLDARLAGYGRSVGATYTRYADDLTFSGPAGLRPRTGALVRAVTRVAAEEGFLIHPGKTRVQSRTQRQQVTGMIVNDQLGLPRAEVDRLRAVLHDTASHGPEVANRTGHPAFRSYLEGRVGWVESVNPARGRRLRTQLEAISWPDP